MSEEEKVERIKQILSETKWKSSYNKEIIELYKSIDTDGQKQILNGIKDKSININSSASSIFSRINFWDIFLNSSITNQEENIEYLFDDFFSNCDGKDPEYIANRIKSFTTKFENTQLRFTLNYIYPQLCKKMLDFNKGDKTLKTEKLNFYLEILEYIESYNQEKNGKTLENIQKFIKEEGIEGENLDLTDNKKFYKSVMIRDVKINSFLDILSKYKYAIDNRDANLSGPFANPFSTYYKNKYTILSEALCEEITNMPYIGNEKVWEIAEELSAFDSALNESMDIARKSIIIPEDVAKRTEQYSENLKNGNGIPTEDMEEFRNCATLYWQKNGRLPKEYYDYIIKDSIISGKTNNEREQFLYRRALIDFGKDFMDKIGINEKSIIGFGLLEKGTGGYYEDRLNQIVLSATSDINTVLNITVHEIKHRQQFEKMKENKYDPFLYKMLKEDILTSFVGYGRNFYRKNYIDFEYEFDARMFASIETYKYLSDLGISKQDIFRIEDKDKTIEEEIVKMINHDREFKTVEGIDGKKHIDDIFLDILHKKPELLSKYPIFNKEYEINKNGDVSRKSREQLQSEMEEKINSSSDEKEKQEIYELYGYLLQDKTKEKKHNQNDLIGFLKENGYEISPSVEQRLRKTQYTNYLVEQIDIIMEDQSLSDEEREKKLDEISKLIEALENKDNIEEISNDDGKDSETMQFAKECYEGYTAMERQYQYQRLNNLLRQNDKEQQNNIEHKNEEAGMEL